MGAFGFVPNVMRHKYSTLALFVMGAFGIVPNVMRHKYSTLALFVMGRLASYPTSCDINIQH